MQQPDQLAETYESDKLGQMAIAERDKALILEVGGNSYTLYPQSESFLLKRKSGVSRRRGRTKLMNLKSGTGIAPVPDYEEPFRTMK